MAALDDGVCDCNELTTSSPKRPETPAGSGRTVCINSANVREVAVRPARFVRPRAPPGSAPRALLETEAWEPGSKTKGARRETTSEGCGVRMETPLGSDRPREPPPGNEIVVGILDASTVDALVEFAGAVTSVSSSDVSQDESSASSSPGAGSVGLSLPRVAPPPAAFRDPALRSLSLLIPASRLLLL